MARVAFINQSAPPHRFIGAETYNVSPAKALMKAGHTVTLLTIDTPETSWEYEGLTYKHISLKEEGEKYDYVLCPINLRQKVWYWLRVNGWTDAKLIGVKHNNSPQVQGIEITFKWDFVIYNSHLLHDTSPLAESKRILLRPQSRPLGKTSLSTGEKIGMVNLCALKGGNEFMHLVVNNPEVEFLGVKGGWGEQITQSLKHEGTPPNLEIIEHTKDLTDAWVKMKVLLLLSHAESWSMVAEEAARYGIPTVSLEGLESQENIQALGGQFSAPGNNIAKVASLLTPNKGIQAKYRAHQKDKAGDLKAFLKYFEED